MKISYKVPLVTSTIVLLAFVIFSVVQYQLTKDNVIKQLDNNIDETTVTLDYQISNWLNGKLALINNTADILSRDLSDATLKNVLNTKQGRSSFNLVYFVSNKDGKASFNNPEIVIPADEDSRTRPWYSVAQKSNRATLTEAYVDETSPYPMISVLSNIKTRGQSQGVIGGDISTKTVSDAMNKINFDGAGYVFLANATGKIIIHPETSLYDKNTKDLFQTAVNIKTPQLQEVTTKKGVNAFVKFRQIEGLKNKDWIIGIVVDKDSILAETNKIKRNAVIGTLLSVLLSSILLYLVMNHLVIRPITSLTHVSNEISRGNLEEEIEGVERKDEIGELANAIQRLQKSLKITLSRLQRNK